MKRALAIITLIMACNTLSAQGLQGYKVRLAQPNELGARVVVNEQGEARQLLNSAPAGDAEQMVNGYRVEIFSDNTSQARRLAYEAYAKFKELYPDMPADDKKDIRYDSPKYTVRIGYYLTQEEAIIMCGKLKNYFKAYPRNEKLPLSVFTQPDVVISAEPADPTEPAPTDGSGE